MVTAVSKKTGQFWTVKARHGTAIIKGLYPGRYKLVAPGYGDYLARTGDVARGVVHAGRPAFGSFRLTQRGGAFTGRLVASDDGTPLGRATVRIYDRSGAVIAATTTASNGTFRVGGRLGNLSSLSLVAFDGPLTAFFNPLEVRALSIRVNQTKNLGDVELPAKPSATLTGVTVDVSNPDIILAGATVTLLDAKNVQIATTTSGSDGAFVMDHRLIGQTGATLVIAPSDPAGYFGEGDTRCQYISTKRGVDFKSGEVADLGQVGMLRKTGGVCKAPLKGHI